MFLKEIACYKEYISYILKDSKICYIYYKLKHNNLILEDEI